MDVDGRHGEAHMLLGLGVPPGGRACREMLERVNGEEGFVVKDISDMDLAQVRGGWRWAVSLLDV